MIETPQLVLRRPIEKDNFTLSDFYRDNLVRAYLGGALSDEIILEKISQFQTHWEKHQFGLCSVVEKKSEQVIGLCGPHYSEEGLIEISYMFSPHVWGKGFGTEAVIASIDYVFKNLKFDTVIAITQEANFKSCRLLERAGMQHINSFERYNAIQRTYLTFV